MIFLTFCRWHTVNLPGKNATAGINHAYIAFVDPITLITDPFGNYIPFETVENMKTRFGNNTKVLISIGGWGSNFTQAAMNATSRARFALGCHALLNFTKADGIGILYHNLDKFIKLIYVQQTLTGNIQEDIVQITRYIQTPREHLKLKRILYYSRLFEPRLGTTHSSQSLYQAKSAI